VEQTSDRHQNQQATYRGPDDSFTSLIGGPTPHQRQTDSQQQQRDNEAAHPQYHRHGIVDEGTDLTNATDPDRYRSEDTQQNDRHPDEVAAVAFEHRFNGSSRR
jgi:hypothetical protein